jgi:hypothetical protein
VAEHLVLDAEHVHGGRALLAASAHTRSTGDVVARRPRSVSV